MKEPAPVNRKPDGVPAKGESVSTSHGPAGPDGGKDRFEAALNHVTTIYGQYIGQRQNLVNYYLAGIALLSVAYAAALDKHWPVAVAVATLGAIASLVAVVQDGELKIYMNTAEDALAYLQEFLVKDLEEERPDRAKPDRKDEEPEKPNVASLKIQEIVKKRTSQLSTRERLLPSGKPFSRGTTIRVIYFCIAIAFLVGAVYAGIHLPDLPQHVV